MDLLSKLAVANVFVVLSAMYASRIIPKLQPGFSRLLAALPVVVVNFVVPQMFDRVKDFVMRGNCLLILTWLANFKVLELALNRGPLCQPLSLSHFALTYALPITPQLSGPSNDASPGMKKVKSNNRLEHSAGTKSTLAGKFLLKMLLMAGIVYILSNHQLPALLGELAQAFCLYFFLGTIMDGTGALVGLATGLPIAVHFDAPYVSASLSEFWSKRWNLTVGNALRCLAYAPISEGRWVASEKPYRHSRLRSALGIIWAFTLSGLMHELILWHLEPKAVSGRWLAFFAVQGPAVVLEALVIKRGRAAGLRLPRWLGTVYTISTLLYFAHTFFYPPIIQHGLDKQFLDSMQQAFKAVW